MLFRSELETLEYLAQVCWEHPHTWLRCVPPVRLRSVLPVLQLVEADVGEAADAGHLLTSFPFTQLHGDQLILQLLPKVQHLGHLTHYALNTRRKPQTSYMSLLIDDDTWNKDNCVNSIRSVLLTLFAIPSH